MSITALYGSSGATLFVDEDNWLTGETREATDEREETHETDWPTNPLTDEELVVSSSLLLK
ncbi:MAG: hypothetical protein KC609_02425 [Myxococcales bacterium]|nr:hypothetical protein [Myxococcales bacterium]